MLNEKITCQPINDLKDLPDDVLITLFDSLNIQREREKLRAISIIKILSDRNKLDLIINRGAYQNEL